jgi:hypothetical protein
MRFTAIFLATLASTVVAQAGHDMANMGASPAATAAAPAGAAAPAAPAATTPAAAAGGAPKGDGKKGAAKDGADDKPFHTKVIDIQQIGDGQVQVLNPSSPAGLPEGTSKTTVLTRTTHTQTATKSKPVQQTKNAGNILNAGSGLGLLGLAAAIIA